MYGASKIEAHDCGMPVSNRTGMGKRLSNCVYGLSVVVRQLKTGIHIGRSSAASPLLRRTAIEVVQHRENLCG